MKTLLRDRITLAAESAADLMNADVRSIGADRNAAEAIGYLSRHGFGAAPVIDDAGRPIGVLSIWDVISHQQDVGNVADKALVRDLMTPCVYSVKQDSPARTPISHLLSLNVHHVFVVDDDGVMVGVISALDVLRKLDLTGLS